MTPRTTQSRNSPGQNTVVDSLSFLQGNLPNSGIDCRSPTLQVDSLPAEPQAKPKNTGVGRLFRLQRIFPTQKSNQGLMHYRRILYQLTYEGSPYELIILYIFKKHFPTIFISIIGFICVKTCINLFKISHFL